MFSYIPTLRIIVVNWNAGEQLRDCIDSISQAKQEGFFLSKVVVVDNSSKDDSLFGIGELGVPVSVIRNKKNLGFAVACNQGASDSTEDYLLFLNPDMRLFESSLAEPIAYMQRQENTDVGVAGIQLVDENARVARSCSRFPSLGIFLAQSLGINRLPRLRYLTQSMAEWAHDDTQPVDQVIGAFFLIRRSIFESLGGFDQRFFVYFEEVDLSYRASKLGFLSVYLTETQAFHVGGGTSSKVKAHRLFYSLRSRLLYGFKHFTPLQAWLLLLITIILEPCSRVLFALAKGSRRDACHTLKGYWMLLRDMHNILTVSVSSKS